MAVFEIGIITYLTVSKHSPNVYLPVLSVLVYLLSNVYIPILSVLIYLLSNVYLPVLSVLVYLQSNVYIPVLSVLVYLLSMRQVEAWPTSILPG